MRILSERMQRLWGEWDIRGMVLVSLTVQITLISFGARRKYIRRTWIQVVVWSMYMIADSVAMFCLGKLSDDANNIDSYTITSTTNNSDIIQYKALWAPLLLLHLGGPDTITAYSVEDVRLYLRHVLGLLLNVGLALYVFLRFWTGALHWIAPLAFLLFVAGIAKYGERSWVLWRANDVFPRPQLPIHFGDAKSILDDLGQDVDSEGKMLALSYIWLQALVPCLTGSQSIDYGVTPSEITKMIWEDNGGESAFKIFEFQLGFLYDLLYTKANIIYTKSGCILRLVSFICVVTALVGFSTFGSHDYSDADVCITYVLLVGAVVLEVYALKLIICSDWVLIWLSRHCKNPFWKNIFRFLAPKLYWRGKRWASSLPSLNLLNESLYDKKPAILYQISKHFGLHKEKFKAFTCRREVDDFRSVKKLIMEELKRQLEIFSKWEHLHAYPKQRGNWALRRWDSSLQKYDYENNCMRSEPITRDGPNWCIVGRSFDISIVIWHLATSYCYYVRDEEQSSSRVGAKLMSDYMMYLLVSRSHMLGDNVEPCDLSAIIGCYAQLMEDTIRKHGSSRDNDYSKLICDSLLTYEPQVCTSKYGRNSNMGSLEYGRIPIDARELAATLMSDTYEGEKWEMMSQVWAEMLCHAAGKCKYETHLRELIQGGEFISQVWLLLLIHGLIEESPTNFLRSLFKSAIPAGTDDATARSNENRDAGESNVTGSEEV